jgi:hypothetical protein
MRIQDLPQFIESYKCWVPFFPSLYVHCSRLGLPLCMAGGCWDWTQNYRGVTLLTTRLINWIILSNCLQFPSSTLERRSRCCTDPTKPRVTASQKRSPRQHPKQFQSLIYFPYFLNRFKQFCVVWVPPLDPHPLESVLWIRINWIRIRIRIQHFKWIRIRGFDEQQLEKITAVFFSSIIAI